MKNKQLIDNLKKLDPEIEILIIDGFTGEKTTHLAVYEEPNQVIIEEA